jgi:hypothetical protein
MNFFGILTIVLIGLKGVDYIDWSWFWVLAPLWLPLSIALFLLLVVIIIEKLQKLFKEKS